MRSFKISELISLFKIVLFFCSLTYFASNVESIKRDVDSTSNAMEHSSSNEKLNNNMKTKTRKLKGCGVNSKSSTRFVSGQKADSLEWPWMAALLRDDTDQYCGGVLITNRHVLTAAHCVRKWKPKDIKIRLGEYDLYKTNETQTFDFDVEQIIIHRDFNVGTYENDIAIIKIDKPAVFNTYVWPACLPPVGLTFENETAIVAGWGRLHYDGPLSTILLEVAVPVWAQENCIASFTQKISKVVMCAGEKSGGHDACQGDSGGPLLYQLENGRWAVIGIVSWGIRCGEPEHPGIYSRVNSYLNWIFENTVY